MKYINCKKNNILINILVLLLSINIFFISCKTNNNIKNIETGKENNSNNSNKSEFKILLIGSSYFNYNDLKDILNKLFADQNKDVYIQTAVENGLYLSDHVDRSYTDSIIKEEKWDYVILQGVGSILAYPEIIQHHPVFPALKSLCNKIHLNNELTKIVFCMPWAFEDGMAWKNGWTDLYPEMQEAIYNNTIKYAEEIGFIIAPVGWAWYKVLRDKNYPLHYLHQSDWNHSSFYGSYIMSCVIYSTIFQEKATDINYFGDIPENLALYFHEISSSIVLEDLELWNILN